jgi:hypothetical protein
MPGYSPFLAIKIPQTTKEQKDEQHNLTSQGKLITVVKQQKIIRKKEMKERSE